MITWFYGNSGAGKTTTAMELQSRSGGVLLDGDAMREVWPGLDFSKRDRYEQNMRIARLARLLHEQGQDVIVATICPYADLRVECEFLTGGHEWVYMPGGFEASEQYPFEKPEAVPV